MTVLPRKAFQTDLNGPGADPQDTGRCPQQCRTSPLFEQ